MKLLPLGLATLSKTILHSEVKGTSPHDFITGLDVLNSGAIPQRADDGFKGDIVKYTQFCNEYKAGGFNTLIEFQVKYCIDDTTILAKILVSFINELRSYLGSAFKISDLITLPRLAFVSFIARHYDPYTTPLVHISNRTKLAAAIRKAYMGGRTEVFKGYNYGAPLYHYDVPGMYALAIQQDLPYGKPL